MDKLLTCSSRGQLFVISAPAGAGKTTLATMLINDCSAIVKSITSTTRSPRVGEVDGCDYHFLTVDQFREKIAAGRFLEYVELYGNYYGTSAQDVEVLLSQGKHVLLVIDTQGAMLLKSRQCQATYIFIAPPSVQVLQERLAGRNTESPTDIELRLSIAEHEMSMISHYDYCIVNDDLAVAYEILKSIVIATAHRVMPT